MFRNARLAAKPLARQYMRLGNAAHCIPRMMLQNQNRQVHSALRDPSSFLRPLCPTVFRPSVMAMSVMPEDTLRKRVEEINEKFVEAREELEFAREEEGTVYFEEEVTMVCVKFVIVITMCQYHY